MIVAHVQQEAARPALFKNSLGPGHDDCVSQGQYFQSWHESYVEESAQRVFIEPEYFQSSLLFQPLYIGSIQNYFVIAQPQAFEPRQVTDLFRQACQFAALGTELMQDGEIF
ncbi:hypothetical protein D3C76_1175750 [compost metagenome]